MDERTRSRTAWLLTNIEEQRKNERERERESERESEGERKKNRGKEGEKIHTLGLSIRMQNPSPKRQPARSHVCRSIVPAQIMPKPQCDTRI